MNNGTTGSEQRPGIERHAENSTGYCSISTEAAAAPTEGERKEIARQKRQEKKATEPVVNLRIPIGLLEEVDHLRSARAGKVSRNTWIVMAIEDQVARLRGDAKITPKDNAD